MLASLGGDAVKASTFSSFITNRESLNNLTSSINEMYRSGLLDGVEIDWEWPSQLGGKKDRIKLIRYARVSNNINDLMEYRSLCSEIQNYRYSRPKKDTHPYFISPIEMRSL